MRLFVSNDHFDHFLISFDRSDYASDIFEDFY